MDVVAGFTTESITHMLGGTYRGGYRPLNDGIIAGRIRGVAGVVGCDNPKRSRTRATWTLVYELLRHDVLVVQTGCSAIACGKAGLLRPEAALEHAGRGPAGDLRGGGHPAGAPRGLVRGQQPDPDRRASRW